MNVSTVLLYTELPKLSKKIMSRDNVDKYNTSNMDLKTVISNAVYERNKGQIILEYPESIKSYLLQLKEICSTNNLERILNLSSKYSIQLYEIFKINKNDKYIINIDEFRKMLQLSQKAYKVFSNINVKVIKPSLEEINKKTDIYVEWETVKMGRRVESLVFIIKFKKDL